MRRRAVHAAAVDVGTVCVTVTFGVTRNNITKMLLQMLREGDHTSAIVMIVCVCEGCATAADDTLKINCGNR